MVDFTKDKTWAAAQVIENNADLGNIGKDVMPFTGDADTLTKSGFFSVAASALNLPVAVAGTITVNANSAIRTSQIFQELIGSRIYSRTNLDGTFSAWQELYHTLNTGLLGFTSAAPTGIDAVNISTVDGRINIGNAGVGSETVVGFYNDNGQVGQIVTVGTSTSFNTSSDPRLKDFKGKPLDADIDAEFDQLFSCFDTFNWKNDPSGQLVWGFDAHLCIDAGLDMGTEGEGSRDLSLGDIYDTTPAELDEDGNEIKPAIEHKVSPAGIDQAKAVPILLAKIEQQGRYMTALQIGLNDALSRLEAAGL